MRKRYIWVVVFALMLLSLVAVSCSNSSTTSTTTPTPTTSPTTATTSPTTTAPTTPTATTSQPTATSQPTQAQPASSEKPQYGGTLVLPAPRNVTYFDPADWVGGGITMDLTMQRLWDGDWAKGPAGGYGADDTNWMTSEDVRSNKRGYIASSITFHVDNSSGMSSIVYDIRQGVHFALNPNSAAARITNGREITADDVVFSLKRVSTPPSMIANVDPFLQSANITKTGPWQVTVTVPTNELLTAAKRYGDCTFPVPADAVKQLGNLRDWHNSVGTGPYILQDYVASGSATLVKNPNYWMTNPVGPGKGDKLPYINTVRWLIIPDVSTQLAAVRTGKVDEDYDVSFANAQQLNSAVKKGLIKVPQDYASVEPAYMVVNNPALPFYNVNVRRAMYQAIDFRSIEKSLYNNTGHILDWPYSYYPAYKDLYLSLNATDCPPIIKQMFTYDPTAAKKELAAAGYPNGFKTTLVINTGYPDEADYYSIIKNYLAAVGIDLTLDPIDNSSSIAMRNNRSQKTMITSATGPPSIWPTLAVLQGNSWENASKINDPKINAAGDKILQEAITDPTQAMKDTRELMKYVIAQAYVIPAPDYPRYTFYWPWIKNYEGERSIGYFWVQSWPQWVWIDQKLKTSMGY